MDLGLTLGSLVAIVILAMLASKMFPNKGRLSADRVTRNMKRFAADATIGDIFLDAAGKAALVTLSTPSGSFGLVRLLGDRVVCRTLTATDIRKIHRDHARITLVLNDVTQPEITLTLSPAALPKAATFLDGLTTVEEASHAA